MKKLNEASGMPQMGRAFAGWTSRITLTKVKQAVVDGLVINSTISFSFMGVIQPLQTKQIMLKPEGERAWEWLQIHCCSTSVAPMPVANSLLWDTPGQQWDTPGQKYDATGPNGMAQVWKNLNVNDQIYHNGKIYKIMGKRDYSLNGFIEYHAIRDYQDA